MKRCIIIIFALVLTTISAHGQNIIIGDKVPEVKDKLWLMDAEPDEAPYTCIMFYHSESELCITSLRNTQQLFDEYNDLFNLVIITKEYHDQAGVTLTSLLSDHTGVIFDEGGKIFRVFGIKFLPFSIIFDQRGTILWCGNSSAIDFDVVRNIVTEKDKI